MKIIIKLWIAALWAVNLLNAQQITRAEYFVDADPGLGQATVLSVNSGSSVSFNFGLDTDVLPAGFHTLYVRTADDSGRWNAAYAHPFIIMHGAEPEPADLVQMEYFIDLDPGFGHAVQVDVAAGQNSTALFSTDISALAPGFHTLYSRFRAADGQWSVALAWPFLIAAGEAGLPDDLTTFEYFVDFDPGLGLGAKLQVTPGQTGVVAFGLNLIEQPVGFHTLYTRVVDAGGRWSENMAHPFFKSAEPLLGAADIVQFRYYFYQNNTMQPVKTVAAAAGPDVTTSFSADASGINTAQAFNLFVFADDAQGRSSVGYVYGDLVAALDEADGDQPLIPDKLVLSGNYPNPFNPSTAIRFGLPVAGQVEITIYNLLGEKVSRLAGGQYPAGYHELRWDGTTAGGEAAASGLYIYEFRAGQKVLRGRMLLVR